VHFGHSSLLFSAIFAGAYGESVEGEGAKKKPAG
jgi:hypothetical protein